MNNVLIFLIEFFENNCGYLVINIVKFVILNVVILMDLEYIIVGNYFFVKWFMKGVYN